VMVVTADHGEEFGEHGGWFHGSTLYHESVAVPLVVRDFRETSAVATRSDAVDLLDVAPTLLALVGVAPPPGMRGRALRDGALAERTLVAELHPDPSFESAVGPRIQRLALLRWPWKVIASREGEAVAYRLDRDPGERAPAEGAPANLASREALAAWLAELVLPASGGVALTPEDREALRALGYAR
jgi:arylsulfatase A-like enzyme